jgi:hypothetical protein
MIAGRVAQYPETQALATGRKIVETFGRLPGIFFMACCPVAPDLGGKQRNY